MDERRSGEGLEAGSLLRAAREGRPEALDRLLATYRHYLRLLAQTSLDSALQAKADPSDVAQETLLKASQRFAQFRGETERELVGWLRRILANHIADVNRRFRGNAGRRLARERSLEEAVERSSLVIEGLLANSEGSPSRGARRQEVSVFVADALAELKPDDRDVIVLRSLQEMEWEDIGRRMKRSAGAARVLWTRALERFGTLIKERAWDTP
jgi:RNA polymerase sigma-70 factor (ECF subfamily)